MKLPVFKFSDLSRAKHFVPGCWPDSRVREIWEKAGKPRKITCSVAAAAILDQGLYRWNTAVHALEWCVRMMSEEAAIIVLEEIGSLWHLGEVGHLNGGEAARRMFYWLWIPSSDSAQLPPISPRGAVFGELGAQLYGSSGSRRKRLFKIIADLDAR